MSLSLNEVVRVNVQITPTTTTSTNFSTGCIFATADVEAFTADPGIYSYTKYNYATSMVEDGMPTTSAAYNAVSKYFAQTPSPDKVVVYVIDEDNSQTNKAAFQDALANSGAYAYVLPFTVEDDTTTTVKTELGEILAYSEASDIPNVCFYQVSETNNLTADGGYLKTAKNANWSKAFGIYIDPDSTSTTIGDTAYAMMGMFCGLNSLTSNSAYTMAYKTLTGTSPSTNVTDATLANLTANNGNAFLRFEDSYNFVYTGVMASGIHLDERYFMDVAATLIKQSVVNLLLNTRKVPQTESGINTVVNALAMICNRLSDIGFIAAGIWRGSQVGNLETGDAIENGYYIYSAPLASQTAEERASRVSPPISVALLSSGAVEHVVINVTISR